MAAVSVYSVEGLAGLGGRLLRRGLLADRFGASATWDRACNAGIAMAATLKVNELDEFYALAAFVGWLTVAHALYASLRATTSPAHNGHVFGAATCCRASAGLGPAREDGFRYFQKLLLLYVDRPRGGRRGVAGG